MTPFKKDSSKLHYITERPVSAEEIIAMARKLTNRCFARGRVLESPSASHDYLSLKLAHLEHEVFCCIFLDSKNRVITFEECFRGTIDGSSVHPREVVKRALQLNAGAIIFAHNHPSGVAEPSQADRQITRILIEALALVDIRVLDHLVVGDSVISFAERGL